MSELILGLFPQPEPPPETIVVVRNGREITVPPEDLWAFSGDAMHYQPSDSNEEGEN
jgi:hypothetical protein